MKSISLNLITLIALATNLTYAQKLPAVQQTSVRAPATLKIDGKANDWGGQFQAYNKSTELFYTIANDDENLYLVVQAAKPRVIEKILSSGVTFTVNNAGKKSDKAKENATIIYPLINFDFIYDILRKAGDKDVWSGSPGASGPARPRMVTLTRTDSTVVLANKAFYDRAKNIKTGGINDIPDTISIYNEHQIKVAAIFDNKGGYTYELALPLKYVGLSIDRLQKFSYNIKLNNRGYTTGNYMDRASGQMMDADPDLDSVTDFWGDYTLAKK